MKFVMSYSCGKDSTLALHKMIEMGHEPVALLVMVNIDAGRSYFHGADEKLLDEFSEALGIPMILCPAKGEEYHLKFEAGLMEARKLGAEAACFGDIDIEGNRKWSQDRCLNTGLRWESPLWHMEREEVVRQIERAGYKCIIKAINNKILPRNLLGRFIGSETAAAIKAYGADACGENGEYHTIAVGGPAFKRPLRYRTGQILDFGDHSVIDINVF